MPTKTRQISTKELAKMNIVQLVQYFNKDWDKPQPMLTDRLNMELWKDAMSLKTQTSTDLERLQALHEHDKASDEYVESIDDLKRALVNSLTEDLQEQITTLQTTTQILLNLHEHDNANVTVGKLNRMKGGI